MHTHSKHQLPDDATAPMWVVHVKDLLKMQGRPEPHQALKKVGIVKQWLADFKVLFVSHQWQSFAHPDPEGKQLRVLQEALLNIINSRVTVEFEFVAQFEGRFRSVSAKEGKELESSYIWFDWFSVPQTEDVPSSQIEEVRSLQMRHILSIPRYVQCSQMFMALVPPLLHLETGVACDYHSWLGRGWCRTEMWCKLLDPEPSMPIMVAFSAEKVDFVGSLSWLRSPVHEGNFAVESDRKVCSQVVRTAMDTYLAHLRDSDTEGNLFRYFAGRYEDLSGLPRRARSLEDFLEAFRFPSLDVALKQEEGIGAVACAAMAGDVELLRRLVEMKASLDTRLQGLWEVAFPHGTTPVMIAATCGQWGHAALAEMLNLKADPNSHCSSGGAAVCFCTSPEGVELLVSHGADVNLRALPAKCSGLCGQLIRGGNLKTCAKLLELRADLGDYEGGLGQTPLQYLLFAYSDLPEGLETAKMLVEARADVNQRGRCSGIFRPLVLACRATKLAKGSPAPLVSYLTEMGCTAFGTACYPPLAIACRATLANKSPSLLVSYLAEMSTTALGTACHFGNPEMVQLLLEARADPGVRNDRGRPAYALARHESVQEVLRGFSRSGTAEHREAEETAEKPAPVIDVEEDSLIEMAF